MKMSILEFEYKNLSVAASEVNPTEEDIEEDIAPEIIKNTQEQTGFMISDYDIVFHGTCKDCQNKKNQYGKLIE